MELFYVTMNKGKVTTLQRACDAYGWKVRQFAFDVPEQRSSDVGEIAMHKARHAYEKVQNKVVVLDAGFYIFALNGFPRAFVNFALETLGLEGILKLVEGKERSCEFRQCLAYLDASLQQPRCFYAYDRGTLSENVRGNMCKEFWSPLAQIFIPQGYIKTLAEMSEEERTQRRVHKTLEQSAERQLVEWLAVREQAQQTL